MKNIRRDEISKLILCIIACQAAGSLGSVFTNMSVATWYPTLAKPWFTPPGGVIGAVWILLFTLMGVSLFLVYREGFSSPAVKVAIYLFAAQFVFNILWSGAFFGLRSPVAGLVVIALLWILILLTIIKFWHVSKEASLLLIPYIAWVSFAAYLNYSIMLLNS
ncbi:MAG: TspO/MBR family protein [Methanothrix sp.]